MTSERFVTIIIPVYNGVSVLGESVGDVFSQDYPHVELIVVNDGSSDGSVKLLETLREKAPSNVTMKIIDQPNGGICSARNAGLDAATGDLIAFMDQDDRIPRDYVSSLVNAMGSEDEAVIGGTVDHHVASGKRSRRDMDPGAKWSMYRNTAPWGRLYRRDIIDANGIRFEDHKISEDFYFNFLYLSYCHKGKVKVVPQSGYMWTISKDSESHANMSKIEEDRDVTEMLDKLLADMKPVTRESALENELFEYLIIKHIVWYLLFVRKGALRKSMKEIYAKCMSWLEEHFPDYKKNPMLKPGRPAGESRKIRFIVRAAMRLHRMHLLLPILKMM